MHVFPDHENDEGSNTLDEHIHIQEVTKKPKGKKYYIRKPLTF